MCHSEFISESISIFWAPPRFAQARTTQLKRLYYSRFFWLYKARGPEPLTHQSKKHKIYANYLQEDVSKMDHMNVLSGDFRINREFYRGHNMEAPQLPPRPEQLIYALMLLQEKIGNQSGTVRQVLNLA